MGIGDEANAQPRWDLHAAGEANVDSLQDGPVGRFMSRAVTYARDGDDSTSRHRGATEGDAGPPSMAVPRGRHPRCRRG
jgi:hypothetical protein